MLILIKKLIISQVSMFFLTFYMSSMALAGGPMPLSLKGVPVPEVPGLLDGPDPIIVDKKKAIVLGKALFWDMNVGSDGVACATCHFHAGADRRIKNQLSPIGRNSDMPEEFSLRKDGSLRGPNATLTKDDFPFFDTDNPTNRQDVTYNSDDVVSSAGTFGGVFRDTHVLGGMTDTCAHSVDEVFHVSAKGTRRVEPRNAPTVINAVFNFRNFWDGRANNIFNGSSEWGDRDPGAGVWVKYADGTFSKERLRLINSSLASQSLAAAVNSVEMTCQNRTLADMGRKLLFRLPLEHQHVHWNDSVLGNYASSTEGQLKKGLKMPYYILIMQAFNPKYWSYYTRGPFGSPPLSSAKNSLPYLQAEANFGMFFALALQLYQSTLVSDDSPFDRSARDENGVPIELSESAQRGLEVMQNAHCTFCHLGANLTTSAVVTNSMLHEIDHDAFGHEDSNERISVNGIVTRLNAEAGAMFGDIGFSATGVTPVENDPGLGGFDPFGNPLSFSDQYMQLLAGNEEWIVDPFIRDVRACDMDNPLASAKDDPDVFQFTNTDGIQPQAQDTVDCFNPDGIFIPTVEAARAELEKPDRQRFLSGANGSFKVPTLRNVELTGPYMHNGGMATLEQVIEFYARSGNFDMDAKEPFKIFSQPAITGAQQIEDVLNFLKSLTDERVRYRRAPFDHPELIMSHGHVGDNYAIQAENPISSVLAADEVLVIPAVGAEGSSEPLQPFEFYLEE
ncbi:MAG: cytochrome-c peroxidase [Burkholderiales bacterium]|nr:cytochrome-c peroxidase [Nitrosomonas sp.]MCP5273374.1 cytochrome-c peroxidase [Burkholderiales bacterium]